MKKKHKNLLTLGVIIAATIGFIWFVQNRPTVSAEVISRSGLHWHATLSIIDGKKQVIPANIGLGVVENPIHTHDTDGIIHLEFNGLVTSEELKLGRFFEVWRKDFSKGKTVKMLVNGEENNEFENYMMKNGDVIEIRYE